MKSIEFSLENERSDIVTFVLEVQGKGKISEAELYYAIPYIMKLMNAQRLLNNMEITVRFGTGDLYGFCMMNGKKDFEIFINKELNTTYNSQISTLCHELVHLKQFARGHLKCENKRSIFNRKVYRTYTDERDMLMPWEVEAYGLEVGLARIYVSAASPPKRVSKKSRSKSV